MLRTTLLAALLCLPFANLNAASVDANHDVAESNTIRWAGCGITRKAFMSELAAAFSEKTGAKVKLEGGGATRGIRDAADMKIALGGSCRMALPEIDRRELMVEMHPVAWDALAIIVHKENPIESLTSEQVRAIYLGKITDWSDVGGNPGTIELYVRDGKVSGVGYAIRQYLFQDSNIDFVATKSVRSSGPLEKAVEKSKNALGITGISSARNGDVKVVAFDGNVPIYENVLSGAYGLYRPLYLVTPPGASKLVREFVAFAQSEEGKQIIRDNKAVPYWDNLSLMSNMVIYGQGVK
jgi:phosphate transport system substrate-binding protein